MTPQEIMLSLYGLGGAAGDYNALAVLLGDDRSHPRSGEVAQALAFLSLNDVTPEQVSGTLGAALSEYALGTEERRASFGEEKENLDELLSLAKEFLSEENDGNGVSTLHWKEYVVSMESAIRYFMKRKHLYSVERSILLPAERVYADDPSMVLRPRCMVQEHIDSLLREAFLSMANFLGLERFRATGQLRECMADPSPIFSLRGEVRNIRRMSPHMMTSLARATPLMTWEQLHGFGSLVQEYNLEWALASFDWSGEGSNSQ